VTRAGATVPGSNPARLPRARACATHLRRIGTSRRSRPAASEEGAELVEFALTFGVFAIVMFGIVGLGTALNDYQSLRFAARNAARAAAVGEFGSTTSCDLTGPMSGDPSPQVEELMCLAKQQAGLGAADVRVSVAFTTPDLDALAPEDAVGEGVLVCLEAPATTLTPTLPFASSLVLRAEASIMIEQAPPGVLTGGAEAPFPGTTWAWCGPGEPAP